MKNFKKKQSILILGASSFLAKPLIKSLKSQKKYKILCQSRRDLRESSFFRHQNIELINNKYSTSYKNEEIFKNCIYIVNFINSNSININQLNKIRKYIKDVISISKASLIHISTASVYGNCKDSIITESSSCFPRNNYQIVKFNEEVKLQKLIKKMGSKCFILRPTEIIGDNSKNAIKFIKSILKSPILNKNFKKLFFGNRVMHFVSSKYVVNTIIKIIENEINEGIYLVSQDVHRLNNYINISNFIDKKINSKFNQYKSKINKFSVEWIFRIFFRILKPSTVSPYAKYISNKPIIDPQDYECFEKDFSDHIDFVLNQINIK